MVSPSGLDEALDGAGGFFDLLVRGDGVVPGRRIGDAVPNVLVEEADGDGSERRGRRRDLGEHVDAVGVLGDLPLQALTCPSMRASRLR